MVDNKIMFDEYLRYLNGSEENQEKFDAFTKGYKRGFRNGELHAYKEINDIYKSYTDKISKFIVDSMDCIEKGEK